LWGIGVDPSAGVLVGLLIKPPLALFVPAPVRFDCEEVGTKSVEDAPDVYAPDVLCVG
jgi:hypothetical protein